MPHIHEKIDFTSEVFVLYNNKVLLRRHDKYNIWLGVGGHIELDEDPNEAAVREVKEEVGLDVKLLQTKPLPEDEEKSKELIPPAFLNRHPINETHEHITLVYFAQAQTDKLHLSEDEKSEDCRWFSLEDLEQEKDNIKPHILFYAKAALEAANRNKKMD